MENHVEPDSSVSPDPVWRMSTVDGMVHESLLSRIEHGERELGLTRLLVLATAFGTTPDDLMQRAQKLAGLTGTRLPEELAIGPNDTVDVVGSEARPRAAP